MTRVSLDDIKEFAKDMPGGFFIYKGDETGELLFVNDVILDIFGCETIEEYKEFTGFIFRGNVHPEDVDIMETSISQQVEANDKRLDYVEYRIIRKDGEVRWVEDFGRLVDTEDYGEVYYVFIRDITEKYIMAKELEEKRNAEFELERQRQINEVKTSFLFNLSHDIRTPMNAIMGYTELSKRHMEDKELLSDYLSKVYNSSRHLLSLIDDLLEMSRLQSNDLEIRYEVCKLDEQIDMTVDMFQTIADHKDIIIKRDYDDIDDFVYVDAMRLRRVLGNLIDNAVKFTSEGGEVSVKGMRKQTSKSGYTRYVFTIKDTGVGMSIEFMKHIYDVFEREETSTKTGTIGTGLGLAITKRMLDLMGGTINVESVKGEGTTFTVELPIKLAENDGTVKIAEHAGDEVLKAAGEYRILLVEDIDINRMMAEQILKEAGFLVESVTDGSDAVEAVKNHPVWYYDLVLMDIQMPVMNGYEATRAIRALKRDDTAVIPIIALSANARDEDKKMSMESGMDSHVAKPFDIEQLIQTINRFIGKEK